MLSKQEAEARLQRYRGGVSMRRAARLAVGGPLARELDMWVTDRHSSDPALLGARLDELTPARLRKTMTAVSPALGDALARWWVWAQTAPYQAGWERRGFRSSDRADSRSTRTLALAHFVGLSRDWNQDAAWFAEWWIHLGYQYAPLGQLMASEITHGNAAIARILTDSVRGRHEVGGITTAGIAGLLGSDRSECWDVVAELLENAGRQEGLRSAVLEAVDLAHPQAFRRILEVVVEQRLTRFAGTVRAAGVWFGEQFDPRRDVELRAILTDLRSILRDGDSLQSGRDADPRRVFLTLWSRALTDARAAVEQARPHLTHSDPEVRRAASRVLTELQLPAAREAITGLLSDDVEEVYAAAVNAWPAHPNTGVGDLSHAARAALTKRIESLGKARDVEVGVLGKRTVKIGSAQAADVIVGNSGRMPVPGHIVMAASADGRAVAMRRLAQNPHANRDAIFPFLADASSYVRSQAFAALQGTRAISLREAQLLEDILRRKASDQRRIAMTLLLRQDTESVRATIARLESGTAEQSRGAQELAAEAGFMVSDEKDGSVAATRIADELTYRAEERTPAVRPTRPSRDRWTSHHQLCKHVVASLRAWLSEHSDTEVETWNGVELLSNVRWLGVPVRGKALPLEEILGPWWERVAPTLTDGGLELGLLHLATPRSNAKWAQAASGRVLGSAMPGHDGSPLVGAIIEHLAIRSYRASWTDSLLDAAETLMADLPVDELAGVPEVMAKRGRRVVVDEWGNMRQSDARSAFPLSGQWVEHLLRHGELTSEQLGRLWRLCRFIDEPEGTFDMFDGPRIPAALPRNHGSTDVVAPTTVPDQPSRERPDAELVTRAFSAGLATRADLVDLLLSINEAHPWHVTWGRPRAGLRYLTPRRLPEWASSPQVQAVVGEVRVALIQSEIRRGDLPTLTSPAARELRSAYGARSLADVLAALGKRPFTRGYSWTSSRDSALSHLVRIHFPEPGDTSESLGEALSVAKISTKREIELGVYAPQWAALIERHMGWPGYEAAVWWVHAHTKDDSWSVDQEIKDEWASEVSHRTPLDAVDLVRGGADVTWFRSIVDELGTERFSSVMDAAKYASSSGGHKRAELFARALLGDVEEDELLGRMDAKRHQDAVRALGLLPLSGPDDPALLSRYERLRGFVASDRTSGSQRRASESTAVEVALENLARSAGYRDPQRLIWAMEARAIQDLASGPVTANDGDLVVTLGIDQGGKPALTIDRGGKPLKSVPPSSAKVPDIADLKARLTQLRKQHGRMRHSLEDACVRGDRFEPSEIQAQLRHPLLAPMLADLVLVSDEGVIGFLAEDGQGVLSPDGDHRSLDGSAFRIAHPVDLLASGEWAEFQHQAFTSRRTQPFRQLFRELYVPTGSELEPGATSRRYSGHQIESRRAGGIFASRGWVADFETGFSRTYHQEKLVAWCEILGGWGTAAEVEDASIEGVRFTSVGSWDPVSPTEVPPRLFSETMRDLDLVVSVAHSGGVDPETSESATEMRARLVDETADLLGLTNVEVSGHHARIKGALGTYSVQLGSGVVHRLPGNALCIIPVSAQHRGRIFLPFADDDPRTAEVISKVVLLARDDKIQDPTILEQLV